jgi:hypothetical protein
VNPCHVATAVEGVGDDSPDERREHDRQAAGEPDLAEGVRVLLGVEVDLEGDRDAEGHLRADPRDEVPEPDLEEVRVPQGRGLVHSGRASSWDA